MPVLTTGKFQSTQNRGEISGLRSNDPSGPEASAPVRFDDLTLNAGPGRDIQVMQRVFVLAKKGAGYTSPNPLVGAVVVKGDRIIGEGFHQRFGGDHAEVMALNAAGEQAQDADLYVNLEPCAHYGQTPPCVERVIAAGIRRVVVSNPDPNPLVNGRGLARLRDQGISVVTHVQSETGSRLNEAYLKYITTGQPFVTLKWAQSIDGHIATAGGDSQWISSQASRTLVHELRGATDAVLVGIGTALHDNPRLTVRHVPGRQPLRLLIDRQLKIPLDSTLVSDTHKSKTVVFTALESGSKLDKLRKQGVQVVTAATHESGYVDVAFVLDWMASRRLTSLLVEGGSAMTTAFIRNGLADKLMVFIAAKILGKGLPGIGDLGTATVSQAKVLKDLTYQIVGDDLLLQAYLKTEDPGN